MTNGSLPRSDSIRGARGRPLQHRDDMGGLQSSADYDAGETMNEVTTYYLEMKSPSSLKRKNGIKRTARTGM